MHLNQTPIPATVQKQGIWSFDLRRKLVKTETPLCLTLEFQSIPELRITTTPEASLNWEASPGLKGEWLLLFARPHGPEWKPVTLPQESPPADIAWYAIPFSLQPKLEWEIPVLLQIEAGEEASLWLNGRKLGRCTSRHTGDPNPDRRPENVIPLPYSWLLAGENLLVIAARGNGSLRGKILSDEAHSLMHHRLQLRWE